LTLPFGALRSSTQLVNRESNGDKTVLGSHNGSVNVQREPACIIVGNWPFHHDADRHFRRQIVSGSYQHPTAADVHRQTLTLYLLFGMDSVTGAKLDGEASLPPTFRSSEGAHVWD
jgi:hypothetical protein